MTLMKRSLLFRLFSLRQINRRTTSHACKYTPSGSFHASHMSSLSAYFRGCTQTTFPGLRRYPGLKSSRITCNPRGHVTILSHTVFTTDSDGAPFRTPWLCLHAHRFLKGAGAARPAFRCCFGNRNSALANGRAGIMTCVCA